MRHAIAVFFALLFALVSAPAAMGAPAARELRYGDDNIAVAAYLEQDAAAPDKATLALAFTPKDGEWHGYWSNPGDAGQGMRLDLDLPPGWTAGEPLYPVPTTLEIAGLMNHVYKGPYAVLVPLRRTDGTAPPRGFTRSSYARALHGLAARLGSEVGLRPQAGKGPGASSGRSSQHHLQQVRS